MPSLKKENIYSGRNKINYMIKSKPYFIENAKKMFDEAELLKVGEE